MTRRWDITFPVLFSFVVFLAVVHLSHGAIDNGGFAGDLSGWNYGQGVDYSPFGLDTSYSPADGIADLSQYSDYSHDADGYLPNLGSSVLWQEFLVDPGTGSLSFQFKPEGTFSETDHFYVSLLESVVSPGDPLSGNATYGVTGQSYFYHWDSNPISADEAAAGVDVTTEEVISGFGDYTLYTVTLNITDPTLYGQNAVLLFELEHHTESENVDTFIGLDNVLLEAQVIPAPSALVLGLIGFFGTGILRIGRRRQS